MSNVGPSHYNCNEIRHDKGFDEAWDIINKLRLKLGPDDFWLWLGKKVPNRIVPVYAILSPELLKEKFRDKL
jgi:hypothetical protein